MKSMLNKLVLSAAALSASGSAFAAGAVADEWKWMTFAVFGAIIAITMAHHFLGGAHHAYNVRILRCRPFGQRYPERLGDRG